MDFIYQIFEYFIIAITYTIYKVPQAHPIIILHKSLTFELDTIMIKIK
jgi:hypothetical protein